jgi:hypothetical protein
MANQLISLTLCGAIRKNDCRVGTCRNHEIFEIFTKARVEARGRGGERFAVGLGPALIPLLVGRWPCLQAALHRFHTFSIAKVIL